MKNIDCFKEGDIKDFKPGDRLYIRKTIGSSPNTYNVDLLCEFIKVVKGVVYGRAIDIPDGGLYSKEREYIRVRLDESKIISARVSKGRLLKADKKLIKDRFDINAEVMK